MIKNILVFGLLFLSKFLVAQDDVPRAIWAASPVKIDGNAQEWKLPLRFYDDGTKLFFAFANDDKNLYICFQAPDDMFQRKIMGAGMEVSFSIKGKHKVSVTFPLDQQSAPSAPQNDADAQPGIDRKNRRTAFILQNTLMNIEGFVTRNGMISIDDTSGINVAIGWDDNSKLTYEMAIPFEEWLGAGYSLPTLSKDISMDVIINALKQPRHNNSENRIPGKGGMGDGMHHRRNSAADEESHVMPGEYKYTLYEKRKLKQKFILAQRSNAK